MSVNKNYDSTQRTKIIGSRTVFANRINTEQLIQNGVPVGNMLRTNPTNSDASYVVEIGLGATNTTGDELRLYIGEPQSTPQPDNQPGALDAPVITSITPRNQSLVVNFNTPASDGGSAIVNYLYSTDAGTSWYAFSPAITSSPCIITALSTDGTTGLTNGTSYDVQLRAVNGIDVSDGSNIVSSSPNETIESFTTVGSTSWTAPEGTFSVEYLVVGGGGGGGSGWDAVAAGGGGAGQVLNGTLSVTGGQSYSVIVGNGGAGGVATGRSEPQCPNGTDGDSSIFASITALGGIGGFKARFGPAQQGGSQATALAPGGGGGGGSGGNETGGGGGGGNGGAGTTVTFRPGGAGGTGVSNSISGSPVTYGAGGNGGTGQNFQSIQGANGTANTGNGGGGATLASFSFQSGGNGGSGRVIIKY